MSCYKNQMLFLLKSSDRKPSAGVKIKTEKKFGLEEEHFILCRNCGNTITTPASIISVNGRHTHVFTNPEGFIYEIGCFSSAEGCIVYGEPTFEYTWFEGFRWNFCMCSECLIHLGWYYQNGDNGFFGLILDRLIDSSKTH
jgi:hypothetical protein